jgi:hypothetical protein
MRRLRFFFLALTFLLHSAANAQTPPVAPDMPRPPQTNVVPAPDTSGNSARPPSEFKILVPDGFGGLKEVPGSTGSLPDQTDSTTTLPIQPLTEPNDNGGQ